MVLVERMEREEERVGGCFVYELEPRLILWGSLCVLSLKVLRE